jgi:hypothetical protein
MMRTSTVRRGIRWGSLLLLACLTLGACSSGGGEAEAENPAKVVAVKGTGFSRVTLTDDAARRVGIELAAVAAGPTGLQVPYGAVLYDPNGATSTFVQTGPFTYLRQPIALDHIDAGVAFLSAGPPVGTMVVTVGATELYGAENGVGDDE